MLFILLLSIFSLTTAFNNCDTVCDYSGERNISFHITKFNGNTHKYDHIIEQEIINNNLILQLNSNDCYFYCREHNDILFDSQNGYYKINNLEQYQIPTTPTTTPTISTTTISTTTTPTISTTTTPTISTTTPTISTTTTTTPTTTTTIFQRNATTTLSTCSSTSMLTTFLTTTSPIKNISTTVYPPITTPDISETFEKQNNVNIILYISGLFMFFVIIAIFILYKKHKQNKEEEDKYIKSLDELIELSGTSIPNPYYDETYDKTYHNPLYEESN